MSDTQYNSAKMYITAMLLSLPDVVIIWVVIIYPVYGISSVTVHPYFHILTWTIFYMIVCIWALYGSQKTSEVVYRTCRLGSILSLLLPVSTGIISVFWAFNITERPDDFLTAFSALEIPVYAAGVAMLFVVFFLFGSYLAAKNMEGVPF